MILNALNISHDFLRRSISSGARVIDATAGNGGDTLLLCELVGDSGHVTAFDIQQAAVDATKGRIDEAGYADRCDVILDSHANMIRYFEKESVDAIVFNFGWLPGGSHDVFTRAESSISAIKQGCELLTVGGVMSLCVYYGRNNGYDERDAILDFVSTLDYRKYTVIHLSFKNRINDPPFPIFIVKEA